MTVRVSDYVLDKRGFEARSRSRPSRAFFARPQPDADADAVRRASYYDGDARWHEEGGCSLVGVPASGKAMAGLRVPAAGETREQGCAVCLEDFEGASAGSGAGDRLRTMPCSHSFHQCCIFRWLRVSRVCSCCRFPLPSADEQRVLDEQAAAAGAGAGTI